MLTALNAKNKLQFINGFFTTPENDDPLHDAWTISFEMVERPRRGG